jgi:hypothetical protein
MTDLSPAQAIVKAFDDRYELLGPLEGDWQEQCIAAALGALADQVVPEEPYCHEDDLMLDYIRRSQRQETRAKFFAIATELRTKS